MSSRRGFVAQLGRVASLGALGSLLVSTTVGAEQPASDELPPGDWDLSWLNQLKSATDRGVFDWSAMETPPEATPLDYAARYLDGCDAVYGNTASARAVLVIRHLAVAASLNDSAWNRYAIGEDAKVNDPATQRPALRNPFWGDASHDKDAPPSLQDVIGRGAIILVCNLALTHLASRLARAHGEDPAAVQKTLASALVPHAYLVPSGIWGLVRAQNAGCGLMRA